MSQIEKMYGKGSIMRLGDNANLNVEVIPTGSLALDLALRSYASQLACARILDILQPPCEEAPKKAKK